MAVAGNTRVGPLHKQADQREAGPDGQWSEERNLLGDPDPRSASDAPTAMSVPDMHRVEEDFYGWRTDDLAGLLERHESQAPTVVQPTQESRGATADAAVSVIEH